jgi:hypothetical protein
MVIGQLEQKLLHRNRCFYRQTATTDQLHNTLAIFFMKTTANKGNNKITELRTILQRESQSS